MLVLAKTSFENLWFAECKAVVTFHLVVSNNEFSRSFDQIMNEVMWL